MSRKRLKAQEKRINKMTRDGLIERNAVTGEDTRVSNRATDFDLRGERAEQDSFSALRKRSDEGKAGGKRRRDQRRAVEPPVNADIAASASISDTRAYAADVPSIYGEPSYSDFAATETRETRREETPIHADSKFASPRHKRRRRKRVKDKQIAAAMSASGAAAAIKQPKPIIAVDDNEPHDVGEGDMNGRTDASRSALNLGENSRLRFSDDAAAPPKKRKQRPPTPENTAADQSGTSLDTPSERPTSRLNHDPAPSLTHDKTATSHDRQPSPLKRDESSPLRFEPQDAGIPPPIKPRNAKPKADNAARHDFEAVQPSASDRNDGGVDASAHTTPPPITPATRVEIDGGAAPADGGGNIGDSAAVDTSSPMPDAPDSALKPDKPGKLQFSEEEAAPSRREVKQTKKVTRAQKRSDRAVTKLDKAKDKLPAKRKLRSNRVFDGESGKSKRKLHFEKEVKSQREHLKGALPLRPVKLVGNTALAFGHRKLFQVQHENAATEAAHKGEMFAEGMTRYALRHHKTAPYRKVAKLERKVRKRTIKLAYEKTLANNPKLRSNILSRAWQKRKIKKNYAKAAREAQKAAERAKKAGTLAGRAARAVAGVIKRHPIATAIIALIVLLIYALMSFMGSFGTAAGGGLGGILSASYLAEDAAVDNAELAYTQWETELYEQISNAAATYPGYDEYRYNVGEISHNPYELMAYLTAMYQNFTYPAIQSELWALFNEQYALTFTETTETRYADPTDANHDGDYEPYDRRVMTVTLTARSFTDIAAAHLNGEQSAHYALLLQTKGARQYVANPFGDMTLSPPSAAGRAAGWDWLPYVTDYYGYRIHPITGAVDVHRGVDVAVPIGTEVHAGFDGIVSFAGWVSDYGYVVVIEDGKGLTAKYAHLDSMLVVAGSTVNKGDVIARSGDTGSTTGAHLHLEILKNGQYLNPAYFADTGDYYAAPSYGFAGAPMGDGSYAALIAEAEKYLGRAYVWGGSNPTTGFDCSGYLSWCLTQSGVKDTGRLTAQGLFNICTPISPSDAKPGDLVFFHSTYSSINPVTHVALYVGDGKILHCGNPIQYTSMETAYWQSHFYAFGRVN